MRLIAILLLLVTTGCSDRTPYVYNKVLKESRTVQVASDAKKTVFISRVISMKDGLESTSGVALPAGNYAVEAEDSNYWYLHAPAPLQLLDCKDGMMGNARKISGGIMIGKGTNSGAAIAVYTDGATAATKTMVWQLGTGFLSLKDKEWKQSF